MSEPTEFFVTDENDLVREWLRQPGLYFEHAAKLAEARRDLDYAKADLAVQEAEVAKDVRENPGDYDIAKVTEAAVKAATSADSRVSQANADLVEARYEVDMAQAAVTTLEHKKRQLENLVSLHGQNYFSQPTPRTAEAAEAVEDLKKTRSRRVKKKRPKS